MSRIGVFLCYCGSNIAATVDVEAVAEVARTLPDVVYVETNKYTCSDPGQEGVRQAIIDKGIDRVVVGACSPRMHEATWRKPIPRSTPTCWKLPTCVSSVRGCTRIATSPPKRQSTW